MKRRNFLTDLLKFAGLAAIPFGLLKSKVVESDHFGNGVKLTGYTLNGEYFPIEYDSHMVLYDKEAGKLTIIDMTQPILPSEHKLIIEYEKGMIDEV